VGFGDELIASGQARGFAARGRRAAFGDGQQIFFAKAAWQVFENNPNVAKPGDEGASDLVWIANYAGHRPYNLHDPANNRWLWKPGTITATGELYFSRNEQEFGREHAPKKPFVVIEPNVPVFKSVGINKQWPFDRYQRVAQELIKRGYPLIQFRYPAPYGPGRSLQLGIRELGTLNFRFACAVMQHAALYLGSEGGMHHAAAALGIAAVVIFGGFISPDITGYPWHENLYAGGLACGNLNPCKHCQQALRSISFEQVLAASLSQLEKGRPKTWHEAQERPLATKAWADSP
jgi:hypothetical protein